MHVFSAPSPLRNAGLSNFRDSNPFLLHGESELKHTETDWNCIVLVRWRNTNKTKQTLELVTRHPHAGFLRDLSRNPSVSFLHLHGCTFHEFQGTCEAGWDDADLVFLPKLCKPLEVRMRKCTKLHHGDKRMHGTFAHDDPSIRVELHCTAEEPRERAKGSHFCRSFGSFAQPMPHGMATATTQPLPLSNLGPLMVQWPNPWCESCRDSCK